NAETFGNRQFLVHRGLELRFLGALLRELLLVSPLLREPILFTAILGILHHADDAAGNRAERGAGGEAGARAHAAVVADHGTARAANQRTRAGGAGRLGGRDAGGGAARNGDQRYCRPHRDYLPLEFSAAGLIEQVLHGYVE